MFKTTEQSLSFHLDLSGTAALSYLLFKILSLLLDRQQITTTQGRGLQLSTCCCFGSDYTLYSSFFAASFRWGPCLAVLSLFSICCPCPEMGSYLNPAAPEMGQSTAGACKSSLPINLSPTAWSLISVQFLPAGQGKVELFHQVLTK